MPAQIQALAVFRVLGHKQGFLVHAAKILRNSFTSGYYQRKELRSRTVWNGTAICICAWYQGILYDAGPQSEGQHGVLKCVARALRTDAYYLAVQQHCKKRPARPSLKSYQHTRHLVFKLNLCRL